MSSQWRRGPRDRTLGWQDEAQAAGMAAHVVDLTADLRLH